MDSDLRCWKKSKVAKSISNELKYGKQGCHMIREGFLCEIIPWCKIIDEFIRIEVKEKVATLSMEVFS